MQLNREKLFPQRSGIVYADWTGAALAPVHLVQEHANLLSQCIFGNPHSHHKSSQRSTRYIDEAREAVLRFLRADPAEYEVVWTANASAAILLLQHYLFEGGELLLTADNHNTMNGLREIARRKGAIIRYAPLLADFSFDEEAVTQRLAHPRSKHHRLFGFPAMSNYSGTVHSLEWVHIAQSYGWDVILDAAAFLANNNLDLSMIKPEFVPMSFYKLFGFPTGIGALVVRKDAFDRLHKRWFAGGTLSFASVGFDTYTLESTYAAQFEDGTPNFQMIPTVTKGLAWLQSLGDRRVHANKIAGTLRDEISDLSAGSASIAVHSPPDTSIVTFSVLREETCLSAVSFEKAADVHDIQVRTGCFCNPGPNEMAMGYLQDKPFHAEVFTLEHVRAYSGKEPLGAIRASFGYANTQEDAHKIKHFLERYLNALS